jgi:uncharacterized protein (TIGR03437 family)
VQTAPSANTEEDVLIDAPAMEYESEMVGPARSLRKDDDMTKSLNAHGQHISRLGVALSVFMLALCWTRIAPRKEPLHGKVGVTVPPLSVSRSGGRPLGSRTIAPRPYRAQHSREELDLDDHDGDSPNGSWLFKLRSFPDGHIPKMARVRAFEQWKRMSAVARQASSASPHWTFTGPQTETGVQAGTGTPGPCAGRVTAIALSPQDASTLYIGGAEGGVWRTTNGGMSWTPLTDFEASLSIGALAIAPSDAMTIYAGTGEQNHSHDEYSGAGILKSADGGSTWRLLASDILSGQTIGALAVSPTNAQIVLAATSVGVFRSADGGMTWQRTLPTDTSADAVVFDPTNSGAVYASVGDGPNAYTGVYKSMDAGATWQSANGSGTNSIPVSGAGRITLAISQSVPPVLYAGVAVDSVGRSDSNMIGFYQSVNGGGSWTKVSTDGYCPVPSNRTTGQCYYNNAMAVNPTNPQILIGGGIELWATGNGGATWTEQTNLHSDQHAVVFSADGTRVYVGNDGGIWTADATQKTYTWVNLNANLGLAQFYPGISISPLNPAVSFGGTQDNNVLSLNVAPSWTSVSVGDGAATAIDPKNPNNVYYSVTGSDAQIHAIYKSIQAGAPGSFVPADSPSIVSQSLPDPSYLTIDPGNPSNLYFTGQQELFQSTDGAGTWNAISGDLTRDTADLCTIAVAPGDSNTVYTGSCDGAVYVTRNAVQGTKPMWANITSGLPLKSVTHIAVDPTSATTAYVTLSGFYSGHVFATENAGQLWTDITNNLPDISANDLVIDPLLPGTLYIATDLGVYWTNNGGQVWSVLGTGLPNSPVISLAFYAAGRILRAATHGRGMWDLPIPANSNLIPVVSTVSPAQIAIGGSTSLMVVGQNFVDGSEVFWNGQQRTTSFVSSNQLNLTLLSSDVSADGLAVLTVSSPSPGGGQSADQFVKVGPAPALAPDGLVNAGGFFPGYGVAPGSIVSAFGVDLNSASYSATGVPLGVNLGGTSLTAWDANLGSALSAFLFFAGAGQINFQVPWSMRPGDTAVFQPVFNGSEGASVTEHILSFAPGIFVENAQNQGAITNATSNQLAAAPSTAFPNAAPVAPGDQVSVYCTGLGGVSNQPANGAAAPFDPLSRTVITPVVWIDGQQATVTFSGLTPGAVGLYQINVVVPADTAAGNAVPLVITDGHGTYSNTVFFAVGASTTLNASAPAR